VFVLSGASFGDPHIITFDGVEYTFNGFGEYTVVSVNSQFVLQGRMQPLNDDHNGKSPATVFTAFAMKQQGGSLIQVSHYSDLRNNFNLNRLAVNLLATITNSCRLRWFHGKLDLSTFCNSELTHAKLFNTSAFDYFLSRII